VLAFKRVWPVVGRAPALLGILLAQSPSGILSTESILARIPVCDRTGHTDRQCRITNVWAAHLRKALGDKKSVASVYSVGYQMPPEWQRKVLDVVSENRKPN
jgi:DNA-binding response OmpR family regulator